MTVPADVEACIAILRSPEYGVLDIGAYFERLETASSIPLPNIRAQIARLLFFVDGERHVALRRSVLAFFRPSTIAAWQPTIAQCAEAAAANLAGRDEVDLVAEFAGPVSSASICAVLGLPEERRGEFDAWSEEVRWLTEPMLPMRRVMAIEKALEVFAAAVSAAIDAGPPAEAAERPTFLHYPIPGLAREDRLWLAIVLYGAGQSTLHTLANVLLLVRDLSQQQREVLCDPVRRMATVDRLLAACGSIQYVSRAMRGGAEAQNPVEIPLAQANLAALAGACPVGSGERSPVNHVVFGAGPHKCVGELLARLIVAEALTSLTRRFPHFAAARPPRGFQSSVVIVSPLDLPCILN